MQTLEISVEISSSFIWPASSSKLISQLESLILSSDIKRGILHSWSIGILYTIQLFKTNPLVSPGFICTPVSSRIFLRFAPVTDLHVLSTLFSKLTKHQGLYIRFDVSTFGSLVVVQFLRFYVSAFTSCVTRTCEMRTGFAVNS